MKLTFPRVLFFVLCVAAAAQNIARTRVEALSEPAGRAVETIRAAVERQAAFLNGVELVIPQLLVGGEWNTTLKLTNRGTATITGGRAVFIDNAGKTMSLNVISATGATQAASGFAFALQQGGVIEVNFVPGTDTAFGHVLIDPASCSPTAACSLYAEATLRNRNATRPDFESVFPGEQPADLQYMLFDHRNGFSTVLYLINSNTTPTTVELEFRGTSNGQFQSASVTLQSGESQILLPHALAPNTIGQHGTIIIRATNAATRALIVATGLRINPSNSFTPLRAFVPRPQ